MIKIKTWLYNNLSDSLASQKERRAFDLFLVLLITSNVLAVILETGKDFYVRFGAAFRAFELFSVSLFPIEYVLRLWTCTCKPKFKGAVAGRLKAALPALAASLAKELGSDLAFQPVLKAIQPSAEWGKPTSLASAREKFLPFSTNVVELVGRLRVQEDAFRALKVYQCPMAPKPGLWFQAQGPLRNPYFGAEMLTCGKEIKEPAAVAEMPKRPAVTPPPEKASTTAATPATAEATATAPQPARAAVPTGPQGPQATTDHSQLASPLPSASRVQPLNSRDHTAFDERMNGALAARIASRVSGATNATRRTPAQQPLPRGQTTEEPRQGHPDPH